MAGDLRDGPCDRVLTPCCCPTLRRGVCITHRTEQVSSGMTNERHYRVSNACHVLGQVSKRLRLLSWVFFSLGSLTVGSKMLCCKRPYEEVHMARNRPASNNVNDLGGDSKAPKPWDDCAFGLHLDYSLLRNSEPESPAMLHSKR